MPRILGIDYGERRVGFAISDMLGFLATPLRTEVVNGDKQAVAATVAICLEKEVEEIVIGMPFNMDGSSGPMVARVEAFISKLGKQLSIPLRTWDERLSSALVERTLLDADMSRAKRKNVRDKLAAQVILQGYLDSLSPPDFVE